MSAGSTSGSSGRVMTIRLAPPGRGTRWKFSLSPSSAPRDALPSSPITAAACSQYLLDLLARVLDPRKRRGRRHPLAGLLAVGIAAVAAGARSFAAIGQWAADAGPEVLAGLGAAKRDGRWHVAAYHHSAAN